MASFEAVTDGIETLVVFPGNAVKVNVNVSITDVNGVDLKVAEVKRQILALRQITNHKDFAMVGDDLKNGRERFRDDVEITYYVDKYIIPQTSFLTFVLKKA